MRALIRADLEPASDWLNLWSNRREYDAEVVKLFTDMGYAPVKVGHDALIADTFVMEIIEDMPTDVKDQEANHLIMLGYTSEGQSHFIVSGVNPAEIHIRVKGRLFGRLTKACADIHKNASKLRRQRTPRLKRLDFRKHDSSSPSLALRQVIEVMEPQRDHPTIVGEIIESARVEVLRQSTYERWLLIFTFVTALTLFLATPAIAPPIRNFFAGLGLDFEVGYIQGALERTYSAFLVTLAVTLVGLVIRMFELRRLKPIKWISDVESRRR